MDEMCLLPASIRSGANFNVYPHFPRIVFLDRIASMKDFNKEIIDAMLITQI